MKSEDIELLPKEYTSTMLDFESITTVTFFRGIPPTAELRSRVRRIVELNPWLGGRLQRRIHGMFVTTHISTECFYKDTSIRRSNADFPYTSDMCSFFSAYYVKTGRHCIDKDEVLFRVTVVELDAIQFALVVSLSHIIADGATYYAVYSMLTTPPFAMIAQRCKPLSQEVMRRCGATSEVFSSASVLLNLTAKVLCRTPCTSHVFLISNTSIATAKKQHTSTAQVPFVSTNDILTSRYFQATNCGIGLLAVNFRDRVSGLTSKHAGNYEGSILYTPDAYATPADIRMKLQQQAMLQGEVDMTPVALSFCEGLALDIAMISNWSTFYHHLTFDNCTHLGHFPIGNQGASVVHVGVIFMMNESQMAFLLMENSAQTTPDYHYMTEDGLLGQAINE